MAEVEKGRWRRLARLGKLGARATGSKLMGEAGHAVLARALVQELGQMKGLPMKVGQLLSYMDGLVPEEQQDVYSQALSALRANAPAVDNAGVLALLEEELGAPRGEVFEAFDEAPIASASIGQVYAARVDGRAVCVKVQYPGIAGATAADMKNLDALTAVAMKLTPTLDIAGILENFRERMREEFDYEREAHYQSRFHAIYRGSDDIVIPEVIEALSSARVLTTERIEGQGLERFLADANEAERSRAGMGLFRFAFGSLLQHDLFHADPHPGNLFFRCPAALRGRSWETAALRGRSWGDKLGVVDFGCVQPFERAQTLRLGALLRAAAAGDDLRESLVDALELKVDDKTLETVAEIAGLMLLPISGEQPFQFSRDFSANISRRVVESKLRLQMRLMTRRGEFSTHADGLMFIVRNLFGLANIWGQLRSRGDYRAEILDLLDA